MTTAGAERGHEPGEPKQRAFTSVVSVSAGASPSEQGASPLRRPFLPLVRVCVRVCVGACVRPSSYGWKDGLLDVPLLATVPTRVPARRARATDTGGAREVVLVTNIQETRCNLGREGRAPDRCTETFYKTKVTRIHARKVLC